MNINVNEIMNYVNLCSDRIWLDGLCGVSYCAGNKKTYRGSKNYQPVQLLLSHPLLYALLQWLLFANILKL